MTDVWSPQDIARTIAEDEHAWTDADAVLVAKAFLELTEKTTWKGVYPGMCHDPELCRGRTSCPREQSCCE